MLNGKENTCNIKLKGKQINLKQKITAFVSGIAAVIFELQEFKQRIIRIFGSGAGFPVLPALLQVGGFNTRGQVSAPVRGKGSISKEDVYYPAVREKVKDMIQGKYQQGDKYPEKIVAQAEKSDQCCRDQPGCQ